MHLCPVPHIHILMCTDTHTYMYTYARTRTHSHLYVSYMIVLKYHNDIVLSVVYCITVLRETNWHQYIL